MKHICRVTQNKLNTFAVWLKINETFAGWLILHIQRQTKHLYNVHLMSGTSFCSHKERKKERKERKKESSWLSVILLLTNKPFLSPWRSALNLSQSLVVTLRTAWFKILKNLLSAHTVHSHVLYGSQNKYRLLPHTARFLFYPTQPQFLKQHCFLEDFQASPAPTWH